MRTSTLAENENLRPNYFLEEGNDDVSVSKYSRKNSEDIVKLL